MNAMESRHSFPAQALGGFAPPQGEPEWLTAFRKTAYEQFQTQGFPTRKHEAWKYFYLEGILNSRFTAPVPLADASLVEKKLAGFKNEMRLVFINGTLEPDYCFLSTEWLSLIETQVSERTLWLKDLWEPCDVLGKNPFTLLNAAFFKEGVFLNFPANVSFPQPLHLIFLSAGHNPNSPVFYPRVQILLEAGANLNVVTHHLDLNNERYLMNGVLDFQLAPNSKLMAYNRQEQGAGALQFLNMRVRQAEGSHFELSHFVSGGAMTRDEVHVDFKGENAFCELSGLSVLSGKSQAFHHLTVQHHVPHCTSRQKYKNILAGESVAEFNSLVEVARNAQKSDSEQMDKNLLLSDNARVYSRPQLKIDADDVRANHGAATGQIDQNEIFYLKSRGLDSETARYLLVKGFAEELLSKFQPELLRQELEAVVEKMIREVLSSGGKG